MYQDLAKKHAEILWETLDPDVLIELVKIDLSKCKEACSIKTENTRIHHLFSLDQEEEDKMKKKMTESIDFVLEQWYYPVSYLTNYKE